MTTYIKECTNNFITLTSTQILSVLPIVAWGTAMNIYFQKWIFFNSFPILGSIIITIIIIMLNELLKNSL